MAIVYLLNEPTVDVKAITVSSNGFSSQWAGVGNVMRLTRRFGRPELPVAFGARGSLTQLNADMGVQPNDLPPIEYVNGSNHFLSDWLPTPFNPLPPSSLSADQLIIETLKEAPGPVDILALGTLTNLAGALHRDRDAFRRQVGTLYLSGGHAASASEELAADRGGQLGFPYLKKPKGSSWNTFLDPIATSQVFASGVPLVMMTTNAQEQATIEEADAAFIPPSCPSGQRRYLEALYRRFAEATNQNMTSVRYWDPSAAVFMVQHQARSSSGAAPMCTDLTSAKVAINLESGPRYSWLERRSFGQPAGLCLAMNATSFKDIFYSTSCRCGHGCGEA